jgi:hypothetical protein
MIHYKSMSPLKKLGHKKVKENCPNELLDKIVEVMTKVREREGSPYKNMIKDTWNDIVELVGRFLNLIKDKNIPGFKEAKKNLDECIANVKNSSHTEKAQKKKDTEMGQGRN